MFNRKRKPGQPPGANLDWFVIPIERIRQWALVLVVLAAAAIVGYSLHKRSARSPEEKAQREIASASALVDRATAATGAARRGSQLAQARDFLQGAQDSFAKKSYDAAFRLAVESQSYAQRALGSPSTDEAGDASFIFVEGDVSLQTAGRSSFEPARQRQSLFDGDFIRTGRTGSAEIMFSDGTLYTIRPGSLFEVRRPAPRETSSSRIKMVSGAINVYTAAGTSTVSTDAATASIESESRVSVDVEKGEKTEVTAFRGKATVSTRTGTALLGEREKVVAGARDGQLSAKVVIPETPELAYPPDNRFYDMKTSDEVELKWKTVPRAIRYRIQISRSRLFVPDATEVDLANRTTTAARVRVSREGSFFWRVAAINAAGLPSDWSAMRRFKMLAEPVPVGMARSSPPRLTVSPPQQMGNLFLVFGKTDPGAIVTINAEPADVEADGSFKKTVTIDREGYATLIVKAVDSAGNETVKPVKVFVESL